MAHTPGPWRYQEESDAYTHIVRAPGNRFICQLSQDRSGEAEANCRLIAAAPDLLAALKAMLTHYGPPETVAAMCNYPADHPITMARAAIAAAEKDVT
jgi:hypothetical protein